MFGFLKKPTEEKKDTGEPSDRTLETIYVDIKKRQTTYLESTQKTHKLKDISKVLRILVEYVRDEKVVNKQEVFSKIRCIHCMAGGHVTTKTAIKLYKSQVDLLDKYKTMYNIKSRDKVVRILLDFAYKDGDESDIFTNIRCAYPEKCEHAHPKK